MGEKLEMTPKYASFVIHEVTDEERQRYRDSPTQSILKTPTTVFKTSDGGSAKRLTFAEEGNGKEGTPLRIVLNGDNEPSTVEVAISPTKAIRVSPTAWKAHQNLTRLFNDYPNETEKTDYAYSPLSPYHGREIVPGVIMPPNMSRPALASYYLNAPVSRYSTPVKRREKITANVGKRLRNWQVETKSSTVWVYWSIYLLIFLLAARMVFTGGEKTGRKFVFADIEVPGLLNRLQILGEKFQQEKGHHFAVIRDLNSRVLDFFQTVQAEGFRIRTAYINCRGNYRRKILQNFVKIQENIKETQKLCEKTSETFRNFSKIFPALNVTADELVKTAIKAAINKYDADKISLPDFALESAGGSVVSTRCTQPWPATEALSFDPRAAIRSGVAPGECWAFQGEGRLLLRLSQPVKITGCSIEHIPATIHPFGFAASAPRDFSLLGLRHPNDTEPRLLGNFIYQVASETVQTFFIPSTDSHYQFIELVVLNNHGHPYTCLYRVRIHGSL